MANRARSPEDEEARRRALLGAAADLFASVLWSELTMAAVLGRELAARPVLVRTLALLHAVLEQNVGLGSMAYPSPVAQQAHASRPELALFHVDLESELAAALLASAR